MLVHTALTHVVVPRRFHKDRRPDDVWSPEEIDRAERIAGEWASVWLTHGTPYGSDPVEWLRVAQGERPDLAATLAAAGIRPAEAVLRINRFGGIDSSGRSLMAEVVRGLSVDQAIQRVQRYRSTHPADVV